MSESFDRLWEKMAASEEYRRGVLEAHVRESIPFQIQALMKHRDFNQQRLAVAADMTQGNVSRITNPDYGKLTLSTIVKVANGFDVAFLGLFVPYSKLAEWITNLSDEDFNLPTFQEENAVRRRRKRKTRSKKSRADSSLHLAYDGGVSQPSLRFAEALRLVVSNGNAEASEASTHPESMEDGDGTSALVEAV